MLMQLVALKVTEVRPVQFWKAQSPIPVTKLGMVTEVRPLQSEKAEAPIEVTESGMMSDVRLLQP